MTHLHGGFVAGDSDGNPAVTPDGFGPGETQTVFYTNQQPQMPAALLWFHDHGLGTTRLNVVAGLAAAYILRDEFDTGAEPNPIGIPGGAYEIPLVIQDRQFNPDGTFRYPISEFPGAPWIGEYFGDVMLVNGKVWPFLSVEPRLYRFRILNGCNARIVNLDIGGTRMWQIGAENGLWDQPVPVRRLVLAPAERADVIVDFSRLAGQTAVLMNHKPPKPISTPAPPLPQVMQIRVGTTVSQPGPTTIPASLPGRAANLPGPVATTRYITLNEVAPETDHWFLNLNGVHFREPGQPITATETPQVGTVEDWVYVNLTEDTHPIHNHLITFQVVGRTPFDAEAYEEAYERPVWRPRRDRPDPVRDRADAAGGTDRARLQGHRQGQPRLRSPPSGRNTSCRRRDRATGLRLPLPHPRARGQRHDAAVHRHRLNPRGGPLLTLCVSLCMRSCGDA